MNAWKNRAIAATMFVFAVAALAGDMVGSKSPGTWVAGSFAQANIKCLQAWICDSGQVLHSPDTVVVTTPNSSSWGTCNAGNGPSDSCGVCSASPPSESCQYWLEKK